MLLPRKTNCPLAIIQSIHIYKKAIIYGHFHKKIFIFENKQRNTLYLFNKTFLITKTVAYVQSQLAFAFSNKTWH